MQAPLWSFKIGKAGVLDHSLTSVRGFIGQSTLGDEFRLGLAGVARDFVVRGVNSKKAIYGGAVAARK